MLLIYTILFVFIMQKNSFQVKVERNFCGIFVNSNGFSITYSILIKYPRADIVGGDIWHATL